MNSSFKTYVLEYDFKFSYNDRISEPLSFWHNSRYVHLAKEKLTLDIKFINIKKEMLNYNYRYFLIYEIYLEKSYQFTFDSNFEIKPNQKSKYLKLEPEILSIFEKHLLLRSY